MLNNLINFPKLQSPHPCALQATSTIAARHKEFEHVYRPPGNHLVARKMAYASKLKSFEDEVCKNPVMPFENLRQEFIEQSNHKNDLNNINQLVNFANSALNKATGSKRERLANLFSSEEKAQQSEFMQKIENISVNLLKEREHKLFELKKERERKRREFVQLKNIQKNMNSCHEIRPYLRQMLLEDSKACQFAQIVDKRRMQLHKKAEEDLWFQLACRANQAEYEKEKDRSDKRTLSNTCNADALKSQVMANNDEKEQQRLLEIENTKRQAAIIAKLKAEEERNKQEMHEKQMKIASVLAKQLELSEQCRKIKQKNEDDFLQMFHNSTMNEIQKEKSMQKASHEALKRETTTYLDFVRQNKVHQKLAEEERERVINEMRLKIECENFKMKEHFKNKRKQLAEKTFSDLQRQIESNRLAREEQAYKEKMEGLQEQEKFRIALEEARKKEIEKRLIVVANAQELKKQMAERKAMGEEQKEIERNILLNVRAENERCEQITKGYIEKHIDYLPLHPNLHLMKTF